MFIVMGLGEPPECIHTMIYIYPYIYAVTLIHAIYLWAFTPPNNHSNLPTCRAYYSGILV